MLDQKRNERDEIFLQQSTCQRKGIKRQQRCCNITTETLQNLLFFSNN